MVQTNKEDIKKVPLYKEVIDWIVAIFIALIISLFIVGNIGSLTRVKGISMQPTFYEDDNVILSRISYKFKTPKKGDIIVLSMEKRKEGLLYNMIDEGKNIVSNISFKLGFTDELDKENLIKRVVAVEGDTIDMKDGKLYINNKEELETSVKGSTYSLDDSMFPLTLGKNQVFVLGDNRENSLDSRILGPIDLIQIKGKVVYRVFPLKRRGRI